jgi:tripartite-type tricarboxylate transporter receptor subunit TctC
MTHRRDALRLVFGLPFSAGLAFTQKSGAQERALSQSWPTRTITVVVPFPPGGTADFAARPLAAYLSERFGKNGAVENKGGAGGGIGHAYVARAEPDGHIIMTALPSLAVIPAANRI